MLNQGYHTLQYSIYKPNLLYLSLAKNISLNVSISFTIFHSTLSFFQHQLLLSSTNLSSPSDIVSTQLENSTSLLNRIVQNRIVPPLSSQLESSISSSNRIVQNHIVPIGKHISHNIVPLSNSIVPNSIVPNNIVPLYIHLPHYIVSNRNILLSNHLSYSFLSASFDILIGLISLIIPIFIVIYNDGSFLLFHYFII